MKKAVDLEEGGLEAGTFLGEIDENLLNSLSQWGKNITNSIKIALDERRKQLPHTNEGLLDLYRRYTQPRFKVDAGKGIGKAVLLVLETYLFLKGLISHQPYLDTLRLESTGNHETAQLLERYQERMEQEGHVKKQMEAALFARMQEGETVTIGEVQLKLDDAGRTEIRLINDQAGIITRDVRKKIAKNK